MSKNNFVSIPILSGRELRHMLTLCGYTGRAFDRFLEKAPDYSSKRLFPMRELSLKISDALYLLVGHDMFWTAYEHPKVQRYRASPPESV